jgi:hypothetical protein
MTRLTRVLDNGIYVVDDAKVRHDADGYSGEAITRLAGLENMYEELVSKQEEISKELERLRSEDKMHSVKFKQLLANKLLNNNILILLKTYGF